MIPICCSRPTSSTLCLLSTYGSGGTPASERRTDMTATGREQRFDQVRAVLVEAGRGAVVLRRPENFAWYTGGAANRVDHASATGVADIVVTREGDHILTNNIESPRMREEQVPGWDLVEYDWHAGPRDMLRKLGGGAAIGADVAGPAE